MERGGPTCRFKQNSPRKNFTAPNTALLALHPRARSIDESMFSPYGM
jgi:hypothetical protein